MSSYAQFMIMLVIFVGVLFATYYVTKLIAGYQKEKTSSGNIEILETTRISATKYIQLVRVGKKYITIAVGKDEITYLGEVSKDDLEFKADTPDEKLDFKEILEKFKSEKKAK